MTPTAFPRAADLSDLVEPAITLAERWRSSTRQVSTRAERRAAEQVAALVADRAGLELAVQFIDRVVRPESNEVAGKALAGLRTRAGVFLDPVDRFLLGLGSASATAFPDVVVPAARARLRSMLGHLVGDAEGPALSRLLREARDEGFRSNVRLLGDAVLGEAEAASRAARIRSLLDRTEIDQVSIHLSSVVSQVSPWDTAAAVARAGIRLRPLYRAALTHDVAVDLEVEEYRDLDLNLTLFTSLLGEPDLLRVRGGLALQAYLPDSRAALEELITFARWRTEKGGAPIKVRLVKGCHLLMEKVEAELRGWVQAPYASKAEVDANFLALIDRALSAEHTDALRVGVGSHNLFNIALAYLVAQGRGVADRLDIEMLRGMAPAQARAVRNTVGSVLLYTPIAARSDFDAAVAYVVRRLEENAVPENFVHDLFVGDLTAQVQQFRTAVAEMRTVSGERRRSSVRPPAPDHFVNTTDSDPALPEIRACARQIVTQQPTPADTPVIDDPARIEAMVTLARQAQLGWAERTPVDRARILQRAADQLEQRRQQLVVAIITEAGKLVGEGDPEVSQAVDFARWYSERGLELDPDTDHFDGADFHPHRLVLVTAQWNAPVATVAGPVLAALAVGSAVLVQPADQAPRCAELVIEALYAAGVPDGVVQIVRTTDGLTESLVGSGGIDAVLVTGSRETIEQVISWRMGRPEGHGVIAASGGRNALVITASADYDLAVADLVRSAFCQAGQQASSAAVAILVGEVAFSARFQRQLVDAVRSLRVGWPDDLGATMGPLLEPPTLTARRALTQLEEHESWLIEPRQLDDTGRLWSPGIRVNLQPDCWLQRTESCAPVLGMIMAHDLTEAIAIQNGVASGLIGGLHSLDDDEIEFWLERVEVGNAVINRALTGAVVGREPFGGWKASVVGPGAKAGGPDYLTQLGTWTDTVLPTAGAEPAWFVAEALRDYLELVGDPAERMWLTAAVRSDAQVWSELGRGRDIAGLRAEQNLLRWCPAPLTVRGLAGARLVEVLRVVLAAELTGTPVRVSLDPGLSAATHQLPGVAARRRLEALQEQLVTDDQFAAAFDGERVRLIGPDAVAVADRMTRPGLITLAHPVLAGGRRELLSVVREQTVSRTRHRYGHPTS